MAEYNGSIDLISGLRPKNNGTFPLVNAKDVQVDDSGKRLDVALSELASSGEDDGSSFEIAAFDLAEMGLGDIVLDGEVSGMTSDALSELMTALESGTVQISYRLQSGSSTRSVTSVIHPSEAGGQYLATLPIYVDGGLVFVTFLFSSTSIAAYALSLSYANELLNAIPTFDLATLGLETILPDGTSYTLETDTAEMRAAMEKGAVKLVLKANVGSETTFSCVMTAVYSADGSYVCSYMGELGGAAMLLTVSVGSSAVSAKITPLDNYIGAYIDAALGGDY